METVLTPPPPFTYDQSLLNLTSGSLSDNWNKWSKGFKIYFDACELSKKSAEIQINILLHIVGEQCRELYEQLNVKCETIQEVLGEFKKYYEQKKNLTVERHRFFTRNQAEGETIEQYEFDLKKLAKSCEFGILCDSLIKDRLVCGISSKAIRERLLHEDDLTLEKAMGICRAAIVSKVYSEKIVQESPEQTVHKIAKNDANGLSQDSDNVWRVSQRGGYCNGRGRGRYSAPRGGRGAGRAAASRGSAGAWRSRGSSASTRSEVGGSSNGGQGARFHGNHYNNRSCNKCGVIHEKNSCPAYGKQCLRCSRMNHFSRMCGVYQIEESDQQITKLGSKGEWKALRQSGKFAKYKIVTLTPGALLVPGFVDCHTHAPQFPNLGSGLDRPLLEWLDKYTFPVESQYKDVRFAAKVYDKVVQRLLTNGTTTACYFGSIHLEGTIELAKSAMRQNQRALVGKVSMNVKNDAGYYIETAEDLEQVETFVQTILSFKNDLIQPVITPRFAISCDLALMAGLARIAKKYGCMTQSHISENLKEVEYVLQMYPSCTSYADVYDKSEILNDRCIMAHAIHLTDAEISLLASRGVSLAHCPASNTRLRSGLCPVRKYRHHGLRVGLGTDVSGGDSASILDAMRRAMDVATHLELQAGGENSIDWKEAFYLATMGGAEALNLDHKIGNFQVGKDFDALLVDVHAAGNIDRHDYSVNTTQEERVISLMQKFVYLADDRNISQVYVKGELVKDLTCSFKELLATNIAKWK